MKKIASILAGLVIVLSSNGQTDSGSVVKQKNFIVSVRTVDNSLIKGRFHSMNDSQFILKTFNGERSIPSENLSSITLKRKNSVLRGTLFGLGIGAVTGIIIGLASGDDPVMSYPDASSDPYGIGTFFTSLNNAFAMTAGEKAVAAGVGLGATGAVVGAIIGAVAKKKFIIHGRREKFHDLQSAIMMKLVKK